MIASVISGSKDYVFIFPYWFQVSGLDLLHVTTEPKSLNLDTISNCCPLTLTFLLMPLVLLVISLVFSALASISKDADVLSSQCTKLTRSCVSPAKSTIYSPKRKFVTVLPPMLIVST